MAAVPLSSNSFHLPNTSCPDCEKPQLVSDVEERKVITSGERRVFGYFDPAIICGGRRPVICQMAMRAGSASPSRERDEQEERDQDGMMLQTGQCVLLWLSTLRLCTRSTSRFLTRHPQLSSTRSGTILSIKGNVRQIRPNTIDPIAGEYQQSLAFPQEA